MSTKHTPDYVRAHYISSLATFLSLFDPFNTDAGTKAPRVSCAQSVFACAQYDFLTIEKAG